MRPQRHRGASPAEREPDDAAGAGGADDLATTVEGAVEEAVSPTAPGHREGSGVVLDLEQVVSRRAPRVRVSLGVGVACACALGVLTLAVVGHGGVLTAWDDDVHAWVVGVRGAADVAVANAVTLGGVTTWTLPAVGVVGALALPGRRSVRARLGAGLLLAAVASAGVYVGLLINHATGRARPPEVDWAGAAGGPSFPSGHTTTATLVALCAAWALSARVTGTRGRRLLWAGAAVWALAVGWSRVWLGVHWPSDVLGGWLFATAWCAVAVAGASWWRERGSRDARRRHDS